MYKNDVKFCPAKFWGISLTSIPGLCWGVIVLYVKRKL